MTWFLANKAKIGALLLALDAIIKAVPDAPPWLDQVVLALATFCLGSGMVKSDSYYAPKPPSPPNP